MTRAAALLIACLAFGGKTARAQQTCPWLTQGTAAAALGGTPEVQVKLVAPAEGSCSFEWKQRSLISTLQIVVDSRIPAACPPGSPSVAGIGDEAAACRRHPTSAEVQYTVESRVRNLHFRIRLTIHGRGKSAQERLQPTATDAKEYEERVEHLAEFVAGNLF